MIRSLHLPAVEVKAFRTTISLIFVCDLGYYAGCYVFGEFDIRSRWIDLEIVQRELR